MDAQVLWRQDAGNDRSRHSHIHVQHEAIQSLAAMLVATSDNRAHTHFSANPSSP